MAPPSPSLSRRASRPLPSPLSFIGVSRSYHRRNSAPREDLPRQGDIGLRAFAFAIELYGGRGRALGLRQARPGWDCLPPCPLGRRRRRLPDELRAVRSYV